MAAPGLRGGEQNIRKDREHVHSTCAHARQVRQQELGPKCPLGWAVLAWAPAHLLAPRRASVLAPLCSPLGLACALRGPIVARATWGLRSSQDLLRTRGSTRERIRRSTVLTRCSLPRTRESRSSERCCTLTLGTNTWFSPERITLAAPAAEAS